MNREQRRNAKHGRYDPFVLLEQDRERIARAGEACSCEPFVLAGAKPGTHIVQHHFRCEQYTKHGTRLTA